MFTTNFISSILSKASILSASETDILYIVKVKANIKDSLTVEDMKTQVYLIQPSDKTKIILTFGNNDPIEYVTGDDLNDFLEQINNEVKFGDSLNINASFEIVKNKIDNKITIYDISLFEKTLLNLSISNVLSIFNRALLNVDYIVFNVLDLETTFKTETIIFKPLNEKLEKLPSIERQTKSEKIKTLCHYSKIDEHKLIPEDFHLTTVIEEFKDLQKLLTTICITCSIIYIFDISSIDDNELSYKINGYKSISGSLDLKKESQSLKIDYYNIYNWVYNGGNINDKIGLARNIISLHFKKGDTIHLKGDPFKSIQSSYKVYEKQNIKQYIEIRNKISDQLLDFNNRANKVIETFASGFQKSGLALISFYTSAIVIRVLGKGEFNNIFTPDATLLSIAFILISYIYFHFSKWEVKEQRRRFVDSYINLKERYTDLLEEDDINRILNNDQEFNSDLKFINDKLKVYSRLWFWFLIILLTTTLALFTIYNISDFLNTTLMQFLFKSDCNCE